MNPMIVAQNRTARLVREAVTPVYSTDTATAARKAREARVSAAEKAACTKDFCFVCSRPTDHFGEHDETQLLVWASTYRGRMLMR